MQLRTDLLIGIEMDIHEQRVADCSLAELLEEVLVRIQETNGLDFVSDELRREVFVAMGCDF